MSKNAVSLETNYKLTIIQRAIEKILNSSDKEFKNRYFIMECIKECGLAFTGWPWPSPFSGWQNSDPNIGLLQIPSELADFSMYVTKFEIHSALEIGVYTGFTSYFLAAMLTRAHNNIEYSMLDIKDNLVGFEFFSSILNIKKFIPCTSKDIMRKKYDLVFIDADHSYKGVLEDFLNIGKYCNKIIAFHDIHANEYNHLDGGTVRMWNEFKENNICDMTILEFSHSVSSWMGIGVGVKYAPLAE